MVFHKQAREFISSLLDYFEREKQNGGPLLNISGVRERVADALKISLSTVSRIRKEKNINPMLISPGKKRCYKKNKTADLPDSTKMEIRNTLYEMYSQHKQVTVATLNRELTLKDISISNRSLNRTLHCIGFKFKRDNPRRALMEKGNIVQLRQEFLRKYMQNMNSSFKREVVFLDETWIFSKGCKINSWQDDSTKSVRKAHYDGRRYIVLHAGSSRGFINYASLLFTSKSLNTDYHGDMNGEIFLKWINEKLIPNLEEPSLIVMDNAPYHSILIEKQPSSAWRKGQLIEWLDIHNINREEHMLKGELLQLAKQNAPHKKYVVDETLRRSGHEVLRLPPYHCHFNSIELIWAKTKDYYNKNIYNNGNKTIEEVWNNALDTCTPHIWENCVRHTENLIKKWFDREVYMENVPEIIIHLGDCNSEAYSSESE